MNVKIDFGTKKVKNIEIKNVDKVVHWAAINECGVWKNGIRHVFGDKGNAIMQVEVYP